MFIKLFRKILARIYYELIWADLKIQPFKFLFHHPKQTLSKKYEENILVDANFTFEERKNIIQAVKDMEYFCNGLIKFNVNFDALPEGKQYTSIILKSTSKSKVATDWYNQHKTHIVGLCSYLEDQFGVIHLISDRLTNHIKFRTTVLHELGHLIGLEHIKGKSIMHPYDFVGVLYMTDQDAKEFCQHYDCQPEDLRYFKLKEILN